jgi:hypothetical protein
MAMRADPDLLARATAARQVIRDDPDVDRLYVLSLVVWPTAALVAPTPARRGVTAEEVARMVELDDGTRSHREIGELVGRPRTTVSMVLRRGRDRALELAA